jgi:TPR repeat protein
MRRRVGRRNAALTWVRRVVGSIGCVLAWAATPALACEALIGTEYSDPVETVPLALDPAQWQVAFRTRNEAIARKEYVKAQETLSDWSELVTWQITFGSKAWDLQDVKNQFLQTLSYECPDVKSAVLREGEGDLLFEWWHGECYGRIPQHHVERLVIGKVGTHQLAYSRKGSKLVDSERDAWAERLSKLTVESRMPKGELSPLDQGRLAVWTRDYPKALALLEPLAKKGNADAQDELGGMYAAGWGVTQDYAKALEWFRKAAVQKNPAASYNVGRFYDNGWGVEKSPAEALKWYRTAAALGDPDAQGRLAFLLATAPEPKYDEAAKLFRTSAERGHEHSVYWIGRLHEEGWGVPKDLSAAVERYRRAAIDGDPDAQYRLAVLHREGRGVARDDQEARKWVVRASMQGHADAEALYDASYRPAPQTPAFPDKLPPGLGQTLKDGGGGTTLPSIPGLTFPGAQEPAGAESR